MSDQTSSTSPLPPLEWLHPAGTSDSAKGLSLVVILDPSSEGGLETLEQVWGRTVLLLSWEGQQRWISLTVFARDDQFDSIVGSIRFHRCLCHHHLHHRRHLHCHHHHVGWLSSFRKMKGEVSLPLDRIQQKLQGEPLSMTSKKYARDSGRPENVMKQTKIASKDLSNDNTRVDSETRSRK